MTTECVFPLATAQLAANIINNTFFAMDSVNRVHVVTSFTLKFDIPVVGDEIAVVDEQLERFDGSYLSPRRTKAVVIDVV